MQLQGARGLAVTEAGELAISMAGGDVRFSAPVAFQVARGQRTPVPAASAVNADEYGFRLGPYDRRRELVVDPARRDLFVGSPTSTEAFVLKLNSDLTSIVAATFIGGSSSDEAWDIAIDPSGTVFVDGQTESLDCPGIGPDPPTAPLADLTRASSYGSIRR